MDERELAISMYERGWSKAQVAEAFGRSWRWAHKWVKRHQEEPELGLADRSRAPHSRPGKKSPEAAAELIALKQRLPLFGPAKLVELLSPEHAMSPWTANEILKGHGLVQQRRPRRGAVQVIRQPIVVPGPGHTMATDYKGQFRLGNGQYCYPLTMADPASRYILAIDAFASINGTTARGGFECVFREYGVPDQIIHDGGSPFCAPASLGGISELTKWWVHLGVVPVRIAPGRPQQNGRLERMHRDLKAWTTAPAEFSIARQQRRFDEFRDLFNTIRPHQAHGQRPPVQLFSPYRRPYPKRLPDIEYGQDMLTRRVRYNGEIKWQGRMVYLAGVLAGETVALQQTDGDWWDIYFGPLLIARWDERTKRVLRIEAVGKRTPHQGEECVSRPDVEGI